MSGWVKLRDGWSESPEIVAVGPRAAMFYLYLLDYSQRNLTDGFVPKSVQSGCSFCSNYRTRASAVSALVREGLVTEVEGGFFLPRWADHILSAARVEKIQAGWAKRQRKRREGEKPKKSRRDIPKSHAASVPYRTPSGVRGGTDANGSEPEGVAPDAALDSAGGSVSPPAGAHEDRDQCAFCGGPNDMGSLKLGRWWPCCSECSERPLDELEEVLAGRGEVG